MVSYSETRPYTVVVAHTLGLVLRPKQILLLTRWKNSQAESVFFFFFFETDESNIKRIKLKKNPLNIYIYIWLSSYIFTKWINYFLRIITSL